MERQSITEAFNIAISDSRFLQSELFFTTLDKSILESEEFKWYSKISLAVKNEEKLTDEEKLHFLAMHRTFLQLI